MLTSLVDRFESNKSISKNILFQQLFSSPSVVVLVRDCIN